MAEPQDIGGPSLAKLARQYEDWLTLKAAEQEEAKTARNYYHGSHWSEEQLCELKKRGQPATTTPLFARKLNGFVGLVEKLRNDPKAYPRTDHEDQGAELCTAALRYAFDQQEWEYTSPLVTLNSSVEGIAGVEIGLEPGDSGAPGDYDVTIQKIDPETFFYDPRSFRHDFADARYMGVAKWLDIDDARALFPDALDVINRLADGQGAEFAVNNQRQVKWVNSDLGQIFVVEHWFKVGVKWFYKVYCGSELIDSGRSYLRDEKGRDECRYVAYRSFVDQDGDAYSFFRNMRSLVDEINQRNSKALHLLAMRRIKMTEGAVTDVEKLRREAVRPDGIIIHAPNTELEFDDAKTMADMKGQLEMKMAAQADLENFGPNPALIGQGVENKSGRAIALLQQAGLSELGPFLLANVNWKKRVYRAVWNAIRRYWTAQRWIRVTDAEGQQQPVPINMPQVDPVTGMRQMVNQIGALDVDIIIDEGPDAVTVNADTLDILQTAAAQGQQIPPQVMLELMPLPDSIKKKLLGLLAQAAQPGPAQQLQIQQGVANIQKTQAQAQQSQANAAKLYSEAQVPQPTPDAGPSLLDAGAIAANIRDTLASADLKNAQASKLRQDVALAPHRMLQDAAIRMERITPKPV